MLLHSLATMNMGYRDTIDGVNMTPVVSDGTALYSKNVYDAADAAEQAKLDEKKANGEVAEDLTQYYATSEQLPTAVALGVLVDVDYTIKAAGGFILQVLPGAYDEDIDNVEKTIASLSSVTQLLDEGKTPKDIVEHLLSDYEIEYFDDVPTKYECDCSRERTDRALISLGKDELTKIINEDGKAQITCHFCDNVYDYTKEELENLLEEAK